MEPRLKIEGVRDLNRLLRRVGGRDLQKQLGQVHRKIGEMVISRLGGTRTGVGQGRGEQIRPSAATREVLLRVGGAHRGQDRRTQWGIRQVWPAGQPPSRPHLIGAAVDIQPEIEREYMDGIDKILRKVSR
jgi:hypothetical protein